MLLFCSQFDRRKSRLGSAMEQGDSVLWHGQAPSRTADWAGALPLMSLEVAKHTNQLSIVTGGGGSHKRTCLRLPIPR